jgi:hypothetical protein
MPRRTVLPMSTGLRRIQSLKASAAAGVDAAGGEDAARRAPGHLPVSSVTWPRAASASRRR